MKFFRSGGDEWPSYEGPRPGVPGCQAPDWLVGELRAKFAKAVAGGPKTKQ